MVELLEVPRMRELLMCKYVDTSYNGYLDDAFKINAFRFLSKPLDVTRLYKALDDANDLKKNDMWGLGCIAQLLVQASKTFLA